MLDVQRLGQTPPAALPMSRCVAANAARRGCLGHATHAESAGSPGASSRAFAEVAPPGWERANVSLGRGVSVLRRTAATGNFSVSLWFRMPNMSADEVSRKVLIGRVDMTRPSEGAGAYEQALPLYRRALEGKEEALGAAHPSTAHFAEILRVQESGVA